jgi:Tfp pilus assembly protein PilN
MARRTRDEEIENTPSEVHHKAKPEWRWPSIPSIMGLFALGGAIFTIIGFGFSEWKDWADMKDRQAALQKELGELRQAVGAIPQIASQVTNLDGRVLKLDAALEQRISDTLEKARRERQENRERIIRLESAIDYMSERLDNLAPPRREFPGGPASRRRNPPADGFGNQD